MRHITLLGIAGLLLGAGSTMGGCSSDNIEATYPMEQDDARRLRHGRLTGEGGFQLFGGNEKKKATGTGIGVNSFLWHASLDTISFMPLNEVDPHGGVIITDWYEDPAAPQERFKLNIVIMGTDLRSDGLRLSVFRQKLKNGLWRDAATSRETARKLEDKILTRARELRIKSAS